MFARLIRQPRIRNDLVRAAARCIGQRAHPEVIQFALWLDSSSQFGALKLFDEVRVKQRAATVQIR
ncbi:hypothetical protein C7G42_11740 [Bradyrhizobium sp. MOS003]|nr:hypothetical protein C7G42_11740 [Bradyrhizobium sp. MOS003]